LPNGKKTPAVATLNEITVVCTYPRWPSTAAEIAALKSRQWSPTTTDFTTVAQADNRDRSKQFQVATLGEFLGAIVNLASGRPRPDRSLDRVVLITHAGNGIVSFKGTVSPGSVTIGRFDAANPLNSDGLEFNSTGSGQFLNSSPGNSVRDDARRKFRSTGEIVLYCCNSGMGVALARMQDLAKTFDVKVTGFANAIVFCPDFTANSIINRQMTAELNPSLGVTQTCSTAQKPGYRHAFGGGKTIGKPAQPFP
jgi:hypothetical protein